jgi:hypothetical protein
MKVYTFETKVGYFEYYDLKTTRNKALEVAKQINDDVLITCVNKPSYRMDWFLALPTGEFLKQVSGISFNN